ncbi:PAAR domain-containing protein [Burkholderia ubonensis]|uniref:PAAR domain-containing protein n=1 Tax=Burkholderia ubonensis TaxID=101571 RepID=UPI0009B3AC69|nr:PAAR domain-containing protein [Burkholderia ubonensis]
MKNEQTASTYLFATIGALTERGGRVTEATGSLTIAGLAVARVGDAVTYEDGSEAVITDGAGNYAVSGNKPFALVGSRLSNGDTVTDSPEREGLVSACTFTVVKRSTVVRQGEGA